MTDPTIGSVWVYGVGVILLLLAVLILALQLYFWLRKENKMCCGSSSVKVSDNTDHLTLKISLTCSDHIIIYMKPINSI